MQIRQHGVLLGAEAATTQNLHTAIARLTHLHRSLVLLAHWQRLYIPAHVISVHAVILQQGVHPILYILLQTAYVIESTVSLGEVSHLHCPIAINNLLLLVKAGPGHLELLLLRPHHILLLLHILINLTHGHAIGIASHGSHTWLLLLEESPSQPLQLLAHPVDHGLNDPAILLNPIGLLHVGILEVLGRLIENLLAPLDQLLVAFKQCLLQSRFLIKCNLSTLVQQA